MTESGIAVEAEFVGKFLLIGGLIGIPILPLKESRCLGNCNRDFIKIIFQWLAGKVNVILTKLSS